jgi:hypothetical protein
MMLRDRKLAVRLLRPYRNNAMGKVACQSRPIWNHDLGGGLLVHLLIRSQLTGADTENHRAIPVRILKCNPLQILHDKPV